MKRISALAALKRELAQAAEPEYKHATVSAREETARSQRAWMNRQA
jgi:hypothetical protein